MQNFDGSEGASDREDSQVTISDVSDHRGGSGLTDIRLG